jgi:hypothetical protein
MKKVLLLLAIYLLLSLNVRGADRELGLARLMLEDAIVRDDASGMRLARERLATLAGESDDRTVRRDAHYLAALSAMFENLSAYLDPASKSRIVESGLHHAELALEIDPQFADAWMVSSSLRRTARRPAAANAPNGFNRAMELDPRAPVVAFINGIVRSMNPNGAALPEGVKAFDEMAERLDAERSASGRPFGLWDAEAHAWKIMVRIAADEPRAETLRPMATRLMAQRPDFALGQFLADAVADHTFVAVPSVTWQPALTDASGDGKTATLPDVVAVDRAESGDRVWYRVTFAERLPRSFGVNVVVNRTGDPAAGMKWWGGASTFHFDRLVTAWISRDGDHYFGRIGVTDDDGARGARFAKVTGDVRIAMASDEKSVILGVPRDALGLTDKSTFVVAGGSHLVWNDDAASVVNSR